MDFQHSKHSIAYSISRLIRCRLCSAGMWQAQIVNRARPHQKKKKKKKCVCVGGGGGGGGGGGEKNFQNLTCLFTGTWPRRGRPSYSAAEQYDGATQVDATQQNVTQKLGKPRPLAAVHTRRVLNWVDPTELYPAACQP